MKTENPLKYSLQLTTYEAIEQYSKAKNISIRQASFIVFSNLKKENVDCGFNLKSTSQFYSSLKRFKFSKMNHRKKYFNHISSHFTGNINKKK